MKAIPLVLVALAAISAPSRSETIEVGDRTITLPDSKVKAALTNPDPTADAEALLETGYEGTAKAIQAKQLLARLKKEGPTDANLAALVELKKKAPAAIPNRPPLAMNEKRVAYNAAIARGFDTGLGFTLPLEDTSRNDYTQLTVLVSTALQTGAITADTPQSFNDIKGKIQTIPASQFVQLMLAYGSYYKGLWDELHAAD